MADVRGDVPDRPPDPAKPKRRGRAAHLPAAVAREDRPDVARIVPADAEMVEVGGATLGYFAGRSRQPAPFAALLSHRRVRSIEDLIRGRHGGPCDTDDGEAYWLCALPHLLILFPSQPVRADPLRWAERWVPRLMQAMGGRKAEAVIGSHLRRPRFRNNAALGRELRATSAECAAYQLHGIAPCDIAPEVRQAEAREAEAERKRAARQAKGSKARAQSLERTKPWEAEGISRSTYKRRLAAARAAGEPSSSGQLSNESREEYYSWPDESGSPPTPAA
ncbi:hypothetical protein ACQVP2_07390 [Methylobacterium aquaticum]|uniref:hypothetical protein n=1 Tax=Methylobacterium aquaticum TaxID=270351 RepID=UPI003D16BC88